jgi:hypothetical protein
MIFTIADIRTLARTKDERLTDTETFPDAWIDSQIDQAFEIAESTKQVFSNIFVYDASTDISNNLDLVTITIPSEVHNIYSIECGSEFGFIINQNKTISLEILPNAINAENKTITIRYFYYPRLPMVSIDMQPEVYHFFRHCLYVNLYGSLRDKENEMYHQKQVDRFVKEGTFTVPEDFGVLYEIGFHNRGFV